MLGNKFEFKKCLLMVLFAIFTFGAGLYLNSMVAYAGGCGSWKDGCNCEVPECVGVMPHCRPGCGSHEMSDWIYGDSFYEYDYDPTCTDDGAYKYVQKRWKICYLSVCANETYDPETVTLSEGIYPALGHDMPSSWQQRTDDLRLIEHHMACQRCGYEETERHVLNTAHQHDDWMWHQDCTSPDCYYQNVYWGWNTAVITFYDSILGNTEQRGPTAGETGAADTTMQNNPNWIPYATAPENITIGGKTRIGWIEHSAEPQILNIGNPAWDGLTTQEWYESQTNKWDGGDKRYYNPYVSSAHNTDDTNTGYDSAAAVYQYNYVTVIYHSGYDGDTKIYADKIDFDGYVVGDEGYIGTQGNAGTW